MSRNLQPTNEKMLIIPWQDRVIEAQGHRPGSPYIEYVWLGTLGPSSTWLWTHLARTAAAQPSTVVDMADLSSSLGLGTQLGPNAMISRALFRTVMFDAARRSENTLAVRLALPDLPAFRLQRLSATARLAHQHLAKGHAPLSPVTEPVEVSQGLVI